MANAIAMTKGTGLISREGLAQAISQAKMTMPSVSGGTFLKMDKGNGDWLFGQEETVVEIDSLWAVNPTSLSHGWVAWDTNAGGAPVQEIMVSINRPLPPESSLPELGLGTADKKGNRSQLVYQKQLSVDLVCISGEDEGTTVSYKQSSVGAMKLFDKLTDDILNQLDKDPDNIVPVVKLTSDSYKHKQYGKIFNPLLAIQEWRSMDDTSPVDNAGGDTPDDDDVPDAEEEARLAAEYEAEQAKLAAEATAPRRRVRR